MLLLYHSHGKPPHRAFATRTQYKMATIFGLACEDLQLTKVGGMQTWKKLMIGVQQLASLLFNNNFINPALVL